MASMVDIKSRIKSVKSTKQITKAMNLVAAAKLQRAKNRLGSTRPFYEQTRNVISNIVKNSEDITHPFIKKRDVKNTVIILITGDRGLCGGYNSNIIKAAFAATKERKNVSIIAVGKKGIDFFSKEDPEIMKDYVGVSEKPVYEDAARIGDIIVDLYTKEEVDEVLLAYTVFESTITHVPTVETLLPIDISKLQSEDGEQKGAKNLMLYEPNENVVLSYVVPKYINTLIYGALAESAACEQGARMTSMDSATKSANETIDSMTILYNRARQSAITQEITEIIGGASALV